MNGVGHYDDDGASSGPPPMRSRPVPPPPPPERYYSEKSHTNQRGSRYGGQITYDYLPPPPPPDGRGRRRTPHRREVDMYEKIEDDDRYYRTSEDKYDYDYDDLDEDEDYYESTHEQDLYYDYDRVLDRSRVGGSQTWDYEEIPPSLEDKRYFKYDEPEVKIIDEYIPPSRAYQARADKKERFDDRDDRTQRSFWDQMGVYNFFWDPRYNLKIPVMQIISIVALMIIFILNYTINIEFVEVLGDFSPYIANQRPEIAWVFALVLALFISIFPTIDREFRTTITLGIIIIVILFFLTMPIITLISTRNLVEVGTSLSRSLIEFIKIMVVLIYWAPILLGVYGIFSRERGYLFLSIIFFIGVIITTDIYLLAVNIEHSKNASDIPLFTIFALALFCFYEMGDSSITFYNMNESPYTWKRSSAHNEHLDRILQKYFIFFILFMALALVLTVPILELDQILSALGSEQIGSSLELASIYGIIVSLFIMVLFLIIIGYILKFENKLRSYPSRLLEKIGGRMSPKKYKRTGRHEREADDDYDIPPPPPSTTPSGTVSIEFP